MLSHMLLRTGCGVSRLQGRGRQLSILIFHRIHARRDPMFPNEPDAATFDWILRLLARGCNVLPLDEAITRFRDDSLPPRPACISFDDGYADNCQVALPLLQRHGLQAAFFVATGFLNGGCMWNDIIIEALRAYRGDRIDLADVGLGTMATGSMDQRRAAAQALIMHHKYQPVDERLAAVRALAARLDAPIPSDIMMTDDELRQLHRAGMVIGGHTVSHPILASIPDAQAAEEIAAGKRQLEAIVDDEVRVFAYPNGKKNADYLDQHVAMVRQAGFIGAVSTEVGASGHGADLFQLRRFTPWDRSPGRFAARLLINLFRPGDGT